jgi:mRNA interferase YafQ
MLKVEYTAKMKQDAKRMQKRGKDMGKLATTLKMLANELPLPAAHRDHALSGNWSGFRECHIENDWVLIYQIRQEVMVLAAIRTGTHADFDW